MSILFASGAKMDVLREAAETTRCTMGWGGARAQQLQRMSVAEAVATVHLGTPQGAGLLALHTASLASRACFNMKITDLEEMNSEEALQKAKAGKTEALSLALRSALQKAAPRYTTRHVLDWITSWISGDPFGGIGRDEGDGLLHPSKLLFLYFCCQHMNIRCSILRGDDVVTLDEGRREGEGETLEMAIVSSGKGEYVVVPAANEGAAVSLAPVPECGNTKVFATPKDSLPLVAAQSYEYELDTRGVLGPKLGGPRRTLLGTVLMQPTKAHDEPMMPAPDTAMAYVVVQDDTLRLVLHVHERSGLRVESIIRSRSSKLTGFVRDTFPPEFYVAVRDEYLTAVVGPFRIDSTSNCRHSVTKRDLRMQINNDVERFEAARQLVRTDQHLRQSPEKSCWRNASFGHCFADIIRGSTSTVRFELWDAITERPIYSQARANRRVMLVMWGLPDAIVEVRVNDSPATIRIVLGSMGVGVHRFVLQGEGVSRIHIGSEGEEAITRTFPVVEPVDYKSAVIVAPLYLHLEKWECAEQSLHPRPLEGTLEDALHMETLLVHGQGFGHVKTLLGVDATKANITEAFDETVQKAVEVKERAPFLDVAVYTHFSGHGHWWKKPGDDLNWEGFVCTDTAILREGGDPAKSADWQTFPGLEKGTSCLTYVDLIGTIEAANRAEVALTLCFDSCYSRSLIRSRGASRRMRPRTISDKIPLMVAEDEAKLAGKILPTREDRGGGREMPGKMTTPPAGFDFICCISACNKDQEAVELQHPLHTDKSMGLLTSAMEVVFYDALVEHVKSKLSGKVPDSDVLSWNDVKDRSRGLFSPIVHGETRPPAGADALLPTPFATFNSSLQVFSSTKSHVAGHLRWRPSASLRTLLSGREGARYALELDQGLCEMVVPGEYLLYQTVEDKLVLKEKELVRVEEAHIRAHSALVPITDDQSKLIKGRPPGSLFVKLVEPEHQTGSEVLICEPSEPNLATAVEVLREALAVAAGGSWWHPTVVPESDFRLRLSSPNALLGITSERCAGGNMFEWRAERQIWRPAASRRSAGRHDVSSYRWEETLPRLKIDQPLEMAMNVRRLLTFVAASLHAEFFMQKVRVGNRHPFRVHFKYYRRQGSRAGPGRGVNDNYHDLAVVEGSQVTLPSTQFVVDTSVTRGDTNSGPNIHTGDRVAFTVDRAITGNAAMDRGHYNLRVLWIGSDGGITQIHPTSSQGSVDVIEPMTIAAGERLQRGPFVVYHNPGVFHLPQPRGRGIEYICFYFTAANSRAPRAFLQEGVFLKPNAGADIDGIASGTAQFNPFCIDDRYDQFVFRVPFLTAPPCKQEPV